MLCLPNSPSLLVISPSPICNAMREREESHNTTDPLAPLEEFPQIGAAPSDGGRLPDAVDRRTDGGTEGRPFTSARQGGDCFTSQREMTKFLPPSGLKRGRGGDAVNGIRRMRERCDEIALLHLGRQTKAAVSRQCWNRDVNCGDKVGCYSRDFCHKCKFIPKQNHRVVENSTYVVARTWYTISH